MPSTGRILKRDAVTLAGQRCLNASGPGRNQSASPPIHGQGHGRIIEQNDSGAIVEVTCECGKVFHLHCTYAAPSELQETQ